ncbi:hypothetical protein WQQ_15240 [Hydrocarboniphaga effusa AP103]|uniref:Uncharacterized protein n=1 Tax=Hydrocarboniphaga effusa AP103 TaxID=1172194 RepID=I7ZI06_9GAMM|nr:hypothetical protein WQQ_15240 [Hydrocarboniphaga effusa AP103]
MKPQITGFSIRLSATRPPLQRSCGMKPQITGCKDSGERHRRCFKGAAA